MVRAKFRCTIVIPLNSDRGDTGSVELIPVVGDGTPENAEFFKYTPGGAIRLDVMNESAVNQFEVGKEYYVDFTPVVPENAVPV